MNKKFIKTRLFLLVIIACLYIPTATVFAADTVYKLPVKGKIDPGLVNLIDKGITEAENMGVRTVILEIDTYGGLVDSAVKIRDSILQTDLETVTFVSGRAWSAGALIALAGEKLFMVEGGSIGAAETRPKEEKYISALRKEFKATAETRDRNPEIAAAMVDSDIVIEGLSKKGKLLTLTAKEAKENNITDFLVADFSALLVELGISDSEILTRELTSTEKLARFVTRPTVSAILLTIGFVALIFEALAPGFGVGGTIGILTLSLFFSGYIINGLASWGLVVLFLAGIILILLEIFVVPGFGITGIGGLIAVLGSLYFTFPTPQIALSILAAVMVLSILSAIILIKVFGGSRFWKNISLGESQTTDSGYIAHIDKSDLPGTRGKTLTPLRPAGIVLINGERIDVVSEGGYIDKDKAIEIVSVSGSRVVVREIKKESG